MEVIYRDEYGREWGIEVNRWYSRTPESRWEKNREWRKGKTVTIHEWGLMARLDAEKENSDE